MKGYRDGEVVSKNSVFQKQVMDEKTTTEDEAETRYKKNIDRL